MAPSTSTSKKLDYSDYAAIPDDGRRHEIIDGEHYVNPATNLYHQAISKRLQYQLYTKIELAGLGTLYSAPCDVQLSARDKSPAQTLFDDMVKHAVTPFLQPIRFRKSGQNFRRRHKEVVQVVNFQSSQGSSWNKKLFYVNVGMAFDDTYDASCWHGRFSRRLAQTVRRPDLI